jgi:hypothetical protein
MLSEYRASSEVLVTLPDNLDAVLKLEIGEQSERRSRQTLGNAFSRAQVLDHTPEKWITWKYMHYHCKYLWTASMGIGLAKCRGGR